MLVYVYVGPKGANEADACGCHVRPAIDRGQRAVCEHVPLGLILQFMCMARELGDNASHSSKYYSIYGYSDNTAELLLHMFICVKMDVILQSDELAKPQLAHKHPTHPQARINIMCQSNNTHSRIHVPNNNHFSGNVWKIRASVCLCLVCGSQSV